MDTGRNEMQRTGRHETDLLQMYESSILYDCTFKVGSENARGGCKEFKCHKLVLAMASRVFEATFCGNFKEAKMGPDKAIILADITPDTFDCAMRFIYGHETNFVNTQLAIEVYKFANKWLVENLMKALEKFIATVEPKMIFTVFDLYKLLNVAHGLDFCRKTVLENSEEALASECWTLASLDTVMDVMQSNCLEVSEFTKVKALVRWGRAQVLLSAAEDEDDSSVRSKIEKCLNFIRFSELEHQEFAQLCRSDLHDVLSGDEKSRVFEAICLADEELMPLQFRSAGANCKLPLAFALPYKEHELVNHSTGYPLKSELQFEVNMSVQLVGLQHLFSSINSSVKKENFESFCFQVRKTASQDILAGGTSADKCVSNDREIFRLSPRCNLEPDTKYSIDIVFPNVHTDTYYVNHTLVESSKNTVTDKDLTLKLHSNVITANVTQLLFKLV